MFSAHTLEKLDQAGIVCFIKQADGRYSFINESAAQLLGLDRADVVKQGFAPLRHVSATELIKNEGFLVSDTLTGGVIGVSCADDEPTAEQRKVLELMRTILNEAATEVVAQIELIDSKPTLH